MKNFYEAMDTVYNAKMSGHAKAVALYLFRRANKIGKCFPCISTIAREVGFSVSTVKRAIAELIEEKFISKINHKRKGTNEYTSNEYTIEPALFDFENSDKKPIGNDRSVPQEPQAVEPKPLQNQPSPSGTDLRSSQRATKGYNSSSKNYNSKSKYRNSKETWSAFKESIMIKNFGSNWRELTGYQPALT